ncbi:microtubule-associated protein 9 isoform X2 [Phyllobates terribilis]|uniref:microtubule-associated protein 9 isoform X2 n=1 Tax=Phyllobates terribilis TaxID=111132 RepID=UPI003CCB1269
MDDDDENLFTFLAYTKSPKTTKTTSFQDELKKAVSARVSRQQAVEDAEYPDYSEEFESDVQGLGFSLSDEGFPPAPLQRNLSERSGHLEDTAEGEDARDKPASLSSPPSLMRLNDNISASKTPSFSERYSLEGHCLTGPPTPASRLKPLSTAAEKNNKARSKEESEEIIKDLQVGKEDFSENKESGGNGRKSPSAFDMMISDVKEKTLQQETKDDSIVRSHEKRDDHEKIKQMHGQLDNQKNLKATLELGRSHSNRSFSASQTKKSSKLGTRVSAKSRYLGTLTMLDTSVNKESGEVEAADKLRATVYQNWLGKKKIFLYELQKIKKAEEELKNEKAKLESTMKKEEAMAAFRAWKAEKKKEIKHSQKKLNMEEMKKMEEIQEIASRKEDCRKAFEKWKEAKEDHLKEKFLKEKHAEKERKEKEKKTVLEKKQENMSAFERWNDRKEHVLKEKKQQEMLEKQKLMTQHAERENKEKIAMEKYEQWLESKERQEKEKIEKKHKKLQVILDDDPPPWSPPGKTIPSGR